MDDIFSTLFGILNANYDLADKVGRDQVGDYTIDTCDTVDQGWETAVWKGDGDMIIVARYESKEEAEQGHEDWVTICRTNPISAWSVQLDSYEKF